PFQTIPMDLRTVLICLISLLAAKGLCQMSMFEQWQKDGDLRLEITTDWDTLHATKNDDELDALMVYNGEEWEMKVQLRGVYRRRSCDFPPFWINLKKGDLRDRGLIDEFDKFKVVTHCVNNEEGQNNQYEEKLIYELYGLLTDESYRVVDAEIVYRYPDDSKPATTARILLLEPTDELAARLGGEEYEQYGISYDSLDARNYNRLALFQFMVGNYDWDYVVQRNVKMFSGHTHYRMVPYDFDFSAIVYPEYARLSGDWPQKDFRDRIFKGKHFYDQLPASQEEFLQKEDEILEFVKNYPHLSKSRCREIMAYLRRFFKVLGNKKTELVDGFILRHL
ncbi:MAG: hypothetical protein R3301_11580, partial [Saprospiraceae bacterium]|nr:hypothetical protein [Saprospiraceae bacterium]